MQRKELELKLQELEGFSQPEAELEQYPTPPDVASMMLWHGFMNNDLKDRVVYDLGCGTGTLAIGAKLLGSSEVVGIDTDPKAVKIARSNLEKLNVEVSFEVKDIRKAKGKADLVVQNPPFGSQRKGGDRPFIRKALEIAPVVYSLHLSKTHNFVRGFVEEQGGRITDQCKLSFQLPRSMPWHREKVKPIQVNLYRFVREK